jgi:hypothetical protein
MFDVLDTVLGAGLTLLAVKVGERRQRKRKYDPSDTKPICGCDHHFSMHNAEGKCHEEIDWQWVWVVVGGKREQQRAPILCGCQRYTGPEPLPAFFDPRT